MSFLPNNYNQDKKKLYREIYGSNKKEKAKESCMESEWDEGNPFDGIPVPSEEDLYDENGNLIPF